MEPADWSESIKHQIFVDTIYKGDQNFWVGKDYSTKLSYNLSVE